MKKGLSIVCLLGACFAKAAALPCATPESQGISSAAILKWIDQTEAKIDSLHSFVLVRHGRVIAQGAWAPYDLNRPHQLYSHSKSFVATAIGFLVDDRKLDLDNRLIEFFPERFPANADEKVRALRVRDLLTMNTGFDGSHNMCVLPEEPDWLKSFLMTKVGVWPGTRFRYDSGATYALTEIVEKISGKPLMTFLQERLFRPIGFGEIYSTLSPTGVACGGWGMYACTPDLAKFGLLYLNEGDWNGQRLLSRDWVRLASAKQTKSGFPPADAPITDWTSGYGFQFWRCRHGAYRADGSHGQYTIVMPEQDAVLSMTACLTDMGAMLNLVWEHLLPAMKDAPLTPDPKACAELSSRLTNLALPTMAGAAKGALALPTEMFTLKQNARGYKSVRLEETPSGWVCRLVIDKVGEQVFPIGFGHWAEGCIWTSERDKKYEDMGALLGEQPLAVSGAWTTPDRFSLRALFLDQAHRLEFEFTHTNGAWKTSGRHIGVGGGELESLSTYVRQNPFPLLKVAKWIWVADNRKEDNQYALFKTGFEVKKNAEPVTLSISVGGNYDAFLNGERIAFSQYTDYPYKKTYTELDLTDRVKEGRNELSVTVHFSGNCFTSHQDGKPGLIAAVTQGGKTLTASGESWLARRDVRFAHGPREKLFVSFNWTFAYDARAELPAWEKARVLPDRACTMTKRPIEPSVIVETVKVPVVKKGTLLRDNETYETNDLRYKAAVRDPKSGETDGIYAVYDLGRECTGHPSFSLDVPRGTKIDIVHGEYLTDGILFNKQRNMVDTYIAKGGKETFAHFLRRVGCRYFELHVRGAGTEVKVPELEFHRAELPNMATPPFATSDPFWMKAHDVSAETLRLCLHEKYENCPWREQSICMYDARNQMLFGYYYWGNYSKAKAMLELFADGLRPDGFMPVTAPGDRNLNLSIPSFTFLWFTALYEYTYYSGDLSVFAGYREMIRGMLDKILSLKKNALYIPPKKALWNYCEAPELEHRTDSPNAFYNLYLLEALRRLSQLFEMTGDRADAERLAALAADIAKKAPAYYYDAAKGAYADAVLADGKKDVFHGHINALFMAQGLVPKDRFGSVLKQILDGRLSLPALNALIYLVQGVFDYGTDEDRLAIHKLLKTEYSKMLDAGATTWWEISLGSLYAGGMGSLCHAWSALPAWYEGAILLGVTPLEPGFKRFRVKPYAGDLTSAKGSVPTPHGTIHVEWKRRPDGTLDVAVNAPGAVRCANSDEWIFVEGAR